MTRERQHHRQRVLSGSDRVSFRGVDHQNPPLGRGRHIDVVDADPGATNDLQATGRSDDLGGDLRAGADHQAVVVADDSDQLILRETGALIHLRHLAEDVDPRLVNGIGNQHFGHDAGAQLPGRTV